MHGRMANANIPVLAFILLIVSGCALWFVPESQSRGHIFDDASRTDNQNDEKYVQRELARLIHERFPPGTSLDDVTGHIQSISGACTSPDRNGTKPGQESTTCTYESENYFAWAFMGMGEPSYVLAEHDWTVFIVHSGGTVEQYVIQSEIVRNGLSRDDYLEGLAHQRAEETLVRAAE